MTDTDQLIGELKKNAIDTVKVQIREYKNRRFLDVRTYSDFGEGNGPRATKKGVAIGLDLIPDLRALLEQAEAVAAGERTGEYLATGAES